MNGGKHPLQRAVVKHGTQQFEFRIRITQSVAVRQKELLPENLRGQRLSVHNYPTLLCEIIATPNVMITNKEMHFHSHIRQLGNLPEKTSITLGHHRAELKPEVEQVAQQINSFSLMLDAI